jgi:hypothetical protein
MGDLLPGCSGRYHRQRASGDDEQRSDEEPAAERTDPDYTAGKAAIDAKDWSTAIRLLSKHYERALLLNPRHRGAHEYTSARPICSRTTCPAPRSTSPSSRSSASSRARSTTT